ncbi:centrosomal protein CCDC61 [Erpetoichthys calabaricus]|uniref:centrosomal protein CCDC61 n=1 Tax=Erpetoichthys calabaricus TaxID=27687 RepID=UPI002234547D|nr:centrosomal protein CCDC61 [Erpetoichthys calabaricus]
MLGRMETVQKEFVFQGTKYSILVSWGEDLLEVEVSNTVTTEQWGAEFSPEYIENLTRKTGNFKEFAIFCNMLVSAVTKSCESVTLQLLTFDDLQQLHKKKASHSECVRPLVKSPALNMKRYFILIYSVEFDRIHYPLPLAFYGKLDPVLLQRENRRLRSQLTEWMSNEGPDTRDGDMHRLQAEVEQMRQEKALLTRELELLRSESSQPRRDPRSMKVLKDMVRILEEQLLQERNKHQRSASKREQEYNMLLDEIEDLKASERKLKSRVKSLTSELAIYKKRVSLVTIFAWFPARSKKSENHSAQTSKWATSLYDLLTLCDILTCILVVSQCNPSEANVVRSYRRVTPVGQPRSGSVLGSDHSQGEERRSTSNERSAGHRLRSQSRSHSRGRNEQWGQRNQRIGSRERSSSREMQSSAEKRLKVPRQSPSPSARRPPRFDPTAYVKDKARKQMETETRNQRKVLRDMLSSPSSAQRGRTFSRATRPAGRSVGSARSSSAETLRSRQSSASSMSETEDLSGPFPSKSTSRNRKKKHPCNSGLGNGCILPGSRSKAKKRMSSTPNRINKASDKENSYELSDIDARLMTVREYLRNMEARC